MKVRGAGAGRGFPVDTPLPLGGGVLGQPGVQLLHVGAPAARLPGVRLPRPGGHLTSAGDAPSGGFGPRGSVPGGGLGAEAGAELDTQGRG